MPVGTMASAVYIAAGGGTLPVLTGLQGWWDADDASTFTFSSGVVVSQWGDKSGNNYHATAHVGQTTPTRDVTINGRAALYFHTGGGAGTALYIPAFAATYTAGEVFIVLDLVTDNGGSYLYAFGTDTQFSHYTAGTVVYENFGTNARKALGTPPIDLTQPHIYNVRTSAGNYVGAFNGVVLYNSGPNTVAFRSTGDYEITQAANSPNGYMGEFIFYDRVLTTPERQQVESYLKTKWGTP